MAAPKCCWHSAATAVLHTPLRPLRKRLKSTPPNAARYTPANSGTLIRSGATDSKRKLARTTLISTKINLYGRHVPVPERYFEAAPALDVLNGPPFHWLGLVSRKPVTEDYVPVLPCASVTALGPLLVTTMT